MKRIIVSLLVVSLSVGYFLAGPGVTKHALIIAIGNYPELSGWQDISSVNDIALIESALRSQGFSHFVVLKDSAADKARIIQAFNELKASVNKNDIVVVHFSSHGQQIMDDNGDEIDGYDEAIVAYGAPAVYDPAYQGENHLRDEELGLHLDDIRAKLGKDGDLLVIVDACHSGTATRGGPEAKQKSRGTDKPFAPAGYKPENSSKDEIGMFEQSKVSMRGNSDDMAPMVVISAARANEKNYEYEGFGSLSVAFKRSFENLSSNYSYRSLFSKIVKEMSVIAPNQTPALEGDIDRLLFGGDVVSQETYYSVLNVDDDFLRISGGALTGLNQGTTIKIYPSGTINTKNEKPLATGKVTYAEPFKSSATVDVKLDGKAADYWVFAEDRTFGDVRVKVSLDKNMPKATKKSLTEFLELNPLSTLEENEAVFQILEKNEKLNLIMTSDASIYEASISKTDGYQQLKEILSQYAQGKFLKELEFAQSDYNVELELVPVRLVDGKIDTLRPEALLDRGGIMRFTTSDKAVLKITNNSSFDVYFNIIDIQPNGVVNPVMPDPNKFEDPKEFKIPAGKSYVVPRKILSFGPPYGTETFKIFASASPLDFSPILKTKGSAAGTRGASNPLETLFQSSYTMTRGVAVDPISTGIDACTFSYTFKIVESRN